MSTFDIALAMTIEEFEEGCALFNSLTNTTHFVTSPLSDVLCLVQDGISTREQLFDALKSKSADFSLSQEEFKLSLNEVIDEALAHDLLTES